MGLNLTQHNSPEASIILAASVALIAILTIPLKCIIILLFTISVSSYICVYLTTKHITSSLLCPQIQIVLLIILLFAIGDFVIGTLIPVRAKGNIVANIDLQGYTFYSGKHLQCTYIIL